jgi:hypothetical protein
VLFNEAAALRPFLFEGAVAGAQSCGQGGDLVAELPV